MIVDRSFDKHNQLTDPFGSGAHAPNDGDHRQARARQRRPPPLPPRSPPPATGVRILNAANFSLFNLELSNGVHDGPDRDRERPDAGAREPHAGADRPGERIEVMLDFSRLAGKRVDAAERRRKGAGGLASKTYVGPLMEFRVGKRAEDTTAVPPRCARCPTGWPRRAPSAATATGSSRSARASRPRGWSTARPSTRPAPRPSPCSAPTETWELHNRTAVAHMIHMHHTDWYMLSRNGKRPPRYERASRRPSCSIRASGRRRRPLHRLHRQVRDPLPHARPRGPRPDVAVRGRRAG